MKISGVHGQLAVGGRTAATLKHWHYEGDANGWVVSAVCQPENEYLLEHSELFSMVLDVGQQVWIWSGVELTPGSPATITGAGRPEVR